MHLDSAGNSIFPAVEPRTQETNMLKERIDGVDYEVGTEPHKAAIGRRDAAEKTAKDELEKLKARADKAEADLATARKDLEQAPTKIAAAAKARADLLEQARIVLGDEQKFDGVEDLEIKRAIAAKANPNLKLDGKPEAYVQPLFEAAIAEAPRSDGLDGLARLREDSLPVISQRGEKRIDADAAWERMVEREQNRWKPKKAQA